MVKKYRKKPVVIEAVRVPPEGDVVSEELKPCPFCGSTKLVCLAPSDLGRLLGEQTTSYVSCKDCGMRGPEKEAAYALRIDLNHPAVIAWNTRLTASIQNNSLRQSLANHGGNYG